MTFKEKLTSLFKEKELSPEEIAENIKEIETYLSQIPKDLLQEYKEYTGKDDIRIFEKERKDGREFEKYYQSNELYARISPENELNLILNRFGHYETGTFRHFSKWNENSSRETNDHDEIIGTGNDGKAKISYFKKEIIGNLEKKMRAKIRNQKLIKPIKQALAKVLNEKN